jgi:hypothetical protein
MKATIRNPRLDESGRIGRYRDKQFMRQISVIDRDDGREIICARFYWPGSVCYCALWVHAYPNSASGHGKAGGYGYHKESAALSDAIRSAGFDLDESIHGCGNGAMEVALIAVARAVTGKRKFYMVRAHA